MNQQTSFRDDDPAAPWMLDRKLGGMTPPSRRKSWEASQARAKVMFHSVDVDGFATASATGRAVVDHEPPKHEALTHGGTTAAEANISAQPYVFRDPTKIPRRDHLYGNHLLRGFTSATVAPGALGKSSLIIAETLAMVTHRPLLKVRVGSRPLRVWLWNLEDPSEEMQRRIQAACLQYGLTADDLGNRLFVNSRETGLVIAKGNYSGAVVLEPVVDAIVQEITAQQIDVLAIDPFVSCHFVSENDNGAIAAVVKAWGRVAGVGNCAIELVHHARKLGPDAEVAAESARGAVALVAACRDVRVLNRMTKAEAERAGVENHRLYFRVYSDKANLAPPSEVSDWYCLKGVDLQNGPLGESDNVQAVVRWSWPDALDGLTARDLFAVQERIAADQWREDPQAAKWAGKAVADVLDLDLELAGPLARTKSLLKTWFESGALKVVQHNDKHRKPKGFVEVGQWATP
jgi:hypothetical protein